MKTLYIAVTFLMTLGIILGIYTSSYNQFNLNGASTSYSTTNQVIAGLNGQYNSSGIASTNSTNNVPSTCVSIIPGACAILNALYSGVDFVECNLGISTSTSCNPNTSTIANNLGSQFGQNLAPLGIPPVITSSNLASNNEWFKLFASPLDSALTIMGVFLGLGILAGLLGAGILARVMASVGIGLAMIDYIEGSLSTFNALPTLIYFGFNGVIGLLLLIIAWEAFNSPGGAG